MMMKMILQSYDHDDRNDFQQSCDQDDKIITVL